MGLKVVFLLRFRNRFPRLILNGYRLTFHCGMVEPWKEFVAVR
jgi:hypothetical protein